MRWIITYLTSARRSWAAFSPARITAQALRDPGAVPLP
jgi:hypothetical protein